MGHASCSPCRAIVDGTLWLSTDPVQLYDTVADIGETTNLASEHPDLVKKLQAVYTAHLDEINANRRPTARLIRPAGAVSPTRPGAKKKAKS